jgi:hypothetical protein
MIEELEQDLTGVICLYCGVHTPLPVSASRGLSTDAIAMSNPPLSIVRCQVCGKEAPYLADEIVVFKGMLKTLRSAA